MWKEEIEHHRFGKAEQRHTRQHNDVYFLLRICFCAHVNSVYVVQVLCFSTQTVRILLFTSTKPLPMSIVCWLCPWVR